jgi:ADP-heptose:LPS heptosyltransferase
MFANKKIIMITPERLGDTLMCTPTIHYVKHHFPSVQIDIIALSELSAEVLKNNPDIHRVFVLPSLKMFKHLEPQYDMAVNIHDEPLGREYIKILNIPAKHLPPVNPNMHQAEQALRFVQDIIPEHPEILERNYRIFPDTEDSAHIERLLETHHIDFKKDILIGFHIGCHSLAKKRFALFKKMTHPKIWPLENFIKLGHKLYKENPHIKIVITGSNSEKKLGKKLTKLLPNIVNLIDQTTVPQLYVLLKHLKAFVTPDTGLMHVACSSEVPLIALFGPTSLKRTGPYPDLKDLTLLQAPTMEEITVDEVFRAVMRKISPIVENTRE